MALGNFKNKPTGDITHCNYYIHLLQPFAVNKHAQIKCLEGAGGEASRGQTGQIGRGAEAKGGRGGCCGGTRLVTFEFGANFEESIQKKISSASGGVRGQIKGNKAMLPIQTMEEFEGTSFMDVP